MEVLPDIHIIEGTTGDRPLRLCLLVGERSVLLDTGASSDPEEIVLPYLESIGVSPSDPALIINTHADFDHVGGNARMKEACPNALLGCGELDRPLVEDPEVMWARRYNAYEANHGIAYDEDTREAIMTSLGRAQPVDLTWRGGEMFRIGPDWEIRILHTPGHTRGHLSVHSLRHRALLTGDAVHGRVYHSVNGEEALCPTYLHVENYLATIGLLENVNAEVMLSCHWPIWRGKQVGDFLSESRQFVESTDRAILDFLGEAKEPLTLKEVIGELGPRLGDWPREVDGELVYALDGHLKRLAALGRVEVDATKHPLRYRIRSD